MPDEQTNTEPEVEVVTVDPTFEIRTWDNTTPEQYEAAPFIYGWPWCEPGQFPVSYKWEAECTPVDPCIAYDADPTVGATLWRAELCTPEQVAEETVPVVEEVVTVATALPPINGPATVTGATPAVTTQTEVAVATPPVTTQAEVAVAVDAPATLPSTGPAEVMGTGAIALILVAIGAALFGISKRKKVNHEFEGSIS